MQFRKYITPIIGTVYFLSLLGMGELRQYFAYYRPMSPQVELNKTVPVSASYGRTVYVTKQERLILYSSYVLLSFSGVGILTIAVLRLYGGKK